MFLPAEGETFHSKTSKYDQEITKPIFSTQKGRFWQVKGSNFVALDCGGDIQQRLCQRKEKGGDHIVELPHIGSLLK
jgi:hypothetical protein